MRDGTLRAVSAQLASLRLVQGMTTTPRWPEPGFAVQGFVGSIRRGADAIVRGAAVFGIGVLLGAVAAIAVDKWRRRRRRVPPTP